MMDLVLDGLTLHYEMLGHGTPLLCLSAFPFGGVMWREQHLLADDARLIIPDYRGVGQSSVTAGPSTMDLLADDMFALLDHLETAQATVMGVSMGGYVALAMYRRRPERIAGLVLADTRAEGDTPPTQERRRQTAEGLRAQGVAVLRDRVDDLFAETTRRVHPALVAEAQDWLTAQSPEGLAHLTLGMALRADQTALLPTIDVPTVLICGEEDRVSPPESMRHMAAAIPGARFYLVSKAGHLAPLEHPAAFNRIVREFLKTLPNNEST